GGIAGPGGGRARGAAAAGPIPAGCEGARSRRPRPMRRILAPLAKFGAETVVIADGGRLPATLRGATDPIPIVYEVPVPSAQIKSAVLLAGLAAPRTTVVIEKGATRHHTQRMLRLVGAHGPVA